MLYGMPYDLEIPVEHPKVEEKVLKEYSIELMKRRQELIKKGLVVQRPPLDMAIHEIKPGDRVMIKAWRESSLTPRWKGSFLGLLTTDTTVRTVERGWTLASRIKGPVQESHWETVRSPNNLKITFRRKTDR